MCTVRLWIFLYFTTPALFYGLLISAFCDDSLHVITDSDIASVFGFFACWLKHELGSPELVMSNWQVTLRIHCVNCNINVNQLHRRLVFDLETRVISLLCTWTSPIIITEDDYICDACWQLAMQTVDSNSLNEPSSSSLLGHTNVCLLCGISLLNRQRDPIVRENPTDLQQAINIEIINRAEPRQVTATDHVCHPCWLRVKRAVLRAQPVPVPQMEQPELEQEPQFEHEPELEPQPQQQIHEPGTINLDNYKRAANTASHCIFDTCQNRDLHRISDALRATTVATHKYYIPVNARVCGEHLRSNNWDLLFESPNSISTFTMEQVEHVFTFIDAIYRFMDFSNMDTIELIDPHLFGYWLGMTKDNFKILIAEVPRVLGLKRGLLGLGALIIKLRTGDSDDRLAILLQVNRRTLERCMDRVKHVLLQDFVPQNLGINHITRNQLKLRNLLIPNALFNQNNENAIIICDGTYIYINKSSNYMFQKDTYSLHKYRNLLKPFMLVATDGYIIDIFGPYKATTSDADIMKSLFINENAPLRQYFQNNDVFILDRGFRDSIPLLEDCGYRALMPESLIEGEHQLTTQQANSSRLVTICRWVVEVVNGYFKRDYKIFRQDFFNKIVPNMMQYFSIAASLINRFGVRLQNRDDALQIIEVINERINYHNNLSDVVEQLNMNRRTSTFVSITADRDNLFSFPRLEYSDLILFALGTYQLRQARSYYGEHVRFHGGYRIEICRENINILEHGLRGSGNNTLIRGKIKSRHISRKIYYVYILLENNIPGREGIIEYCCNCLVGRRTIGCCAHTMTIVWYLGWARYQDSILAPAGFLDNVVVRDDEY